LDRLTAITVARAGDHARHGSADAAAPGAGHHDDAAVEPQEVLHNPLSPTCRYPPMTITGLRRTDHLGADDAILGSVSYARSGVDVAVLASDGTPAAIDETGEIVCRGDVVMSGYWKNPDATAATPLAAHR
jgi:acyl-CoA synthetase (AMP-forming)/AMP-acid ligase II